MAQPNHVLFDHSVGSVDPQRQGAFGGYPFSGNPFSGNPDEGAPPGLRLSQLAYPDPGLLRGRGYAADGKGRNLARPAPFELANSDQGPRPDGTPKVAVLDTPLPLPPMDGTGLGPALYDPAWLPPLLHGCEQRPAFGQDGFEPGVPDRYDGDGFLDRIAGHGIFVASRIALLAPGSSITVVRALRPAGDGDEMEITAAIQNLLNHRKQVDIVNMSFGGYALERMDLFAAAVRALQTTPTPASGPNPAPVDPGQVSPHGAVVVASAGNDATWHPPYPAALPGVVSVAALGPDGPATFTNYGPWVRACAPGVEVRGAFFRYDGGEHRGPTGDPDLFEGGAEWSGTSFAAPHVAGRIAQLMQAENLLPKAAAARLLDAPGLARLPGLGTIVT